MEKKLGEVFIDGDKSLVATPGEDCTGCVYKGNTPPMCKKIGTVAGFCYGDLRDDKISVIFKIKA